MLRPAQLFTMTSGLAGETIRILCDRNIRMTINCMWREECSVSKPEARHVETSRHVRKWPRGDSRVWVHSFLSPELLNNSSLFMYTAILLSDLCLVRFITSLIGTPRSLLLVT